MSNRRRNPRGFGAVHHVPKSSFKDCSMAIIYPTRGVDVLDPKTGKAHRQPMIHQLVKQSWDRLIFPMNGKRCAFAVTGAEVGQAYDDQVAGILAHPELSKWKYVLTLEDDNLPPPMAVMQLLESIELGPFDAVGGLYFTKGDFPMPMAYGDPMDFLSTGVLDFRPRDVTEAIASGGIMPVNGIAMGCSLFRMDVFRKLPRPWFQTLSGHEGKGGFTQDLWLCQAMKRAGMSLAVDCRVAVGHLDVATGEVF